MSTFIYSLIMWLLLIVSKEQKKNLLSSIFLEIRREYCFIRNRLLLIETKIIEPLISWIIYVEMKTLSSNIKVLVNEFSKNFQPFYSFIKFYNCLVPKTLNSVLINLSDFIQNIIQTVTTCPKSATDDSFCMPSKYLKEHLLQKWMEHIV